MNYIVVVKDERGALIAECSLDPGQQLRLGRSDDNDICLYSESISRQHGCIYLENNTAFIADMGSSNGIYVNDERIRREAAINQASRIRIGEFHIALEVLRNEQSSLKGISTAVYSPTDAHAKLIVMTGPQVGREVLLFDPIVSVGRVDENDVALPDISISRHHARLHLQDDDSYILQDLESANGTHVHGRAISRPTRIVHGDRVHFGNIQCLISRIDGLSTPRQGARVWILYGLLVAAAAICGVLASLLMSDR
ncbi:MAG: FHA domain-containing protein [Myxococcota bacterium]|nr:FHA domain-containing protein [Myxococcota bacterium]